MNNIFQVRPTSLVEILVGNAPVRISTRPDPIPVDLRKIWRISVIVLTLSHCRSSRASHEKLLLLNHAFQNPDTQEDLIEILEGHKSPFFLQIRVDPAFARALDFGIGFKLIEKLKTSSVSLTASGIEMAYALNSDSTILVNEKQFLARVGKVATESRVKSILEWR